MSKGKSLLYGQGQVATIDYDHLYAGYCELCEIIHGGPETIVRHRIPHHSLLVPMGFEFGGAQIIN
jgi:hypothetical protein